MNRRTNKAVAQAADLVIQARERLVEWENAKTTAEAELARLGAVGGDEVLDDPEASSRLPRLMQEQRDRIDVAGRAIVAQRGRITAAERAYLSAEADSLEPMAAAKRTALEGHNKKTADLLDELAKHEGVFVPERDLLEERAEWQRAAGGSALGWTRDMAKSEILSAEVAETELPVRVLRAMASGEDPAGLLAGSNAYPACVWGPDALVPAPAYLRSVEAQLADEASARDGLAKVKVRIDELESAIARGGRHPTPATLQQQLDSAKRARAGLLARVSA